MTGYLLDTNVVSDLVRNPQGTVAQRIRKVGETKVCTSIIVASELRYGAEKKGSQRLTTQLEVVLGALQVLPFDSPADVTYGRVRAQLERVGKPIGGNDLLIAAHALTLGYTLVSDNTREFAQVRGLHCAAQGNVDAPRRSSTLRACLSLIEEARGRTQSAMSTTSFIIK